MTPLVMSFKNGGFVTSQMIIFGVLIRNWRKSECLVID